MDLNRKSAMDLIRKDDMDDPVNEDVIEDKAIEEGDESKNPYGGPVEIPDDTNPYPHDLVIIPKIIERKIDDQVVEEIFLDVTEDVEDKHQNYFADQLGFDRPRWTKVWFSSMAMISFAVDLSNLTIFPNNMSRHGGFVYLIVYMVIVVVLGFPMLYLELVVGQYFQTGFIGIWGLCPIFRGVGIGLFYLTFLIISILPLNSLWACLLMSDAITSIGPGGDHGLPWASCEHEWNSCNCHDTHGETKIRNRLCSKVKEANNGTDAGTYTSSEEYFIGKILQLWKSQYSDPLIIKDISQSGNWSTSYGFNNEKEGLGLLLPTSCFILLCIFCAIMVFTLIDIKYQGYMFTFTNTYPIVVLILLFCRASTLEGAFEGLRKYLNPDFTKLIDFSVWYVAFESAFFSIGCGAGCHIVIASFNVLNHNIRRDAVICIMVDTLTSCLACVIAFMFVGHLYKINHMPLPDNFPGENFVFVALAECFGVVSGSAFFAFIFYFMVFVFSLDTQVATLHSISFSLFEEYKRKYPLQKVSKLHFLFAVYGFAFSITLMCTTRGGYWLFSFLRQYFFGLSSFVFMLFETIAFGWFWGVDEICQATETILGHRPHIFLRLSWKYFLPATISANLLYSNAIQEIQPVEVFRQVSPPTAKLGYNFQWIAISIIGFYAVYTYLRVRRRSKSSLTTFMLLVSPEYEHEEILGDAKNAKRLKWRHYTFIRYDDEIAESNKKFQTALQRVKTCLNRCKKSIIIHKNPVVVPKQDLSVSGKTKLDRKEKKKKKKKDQEELLHESQSAWDLWGDTIKKDKAETNLINEKSTKKKIKRQSKLSVKVKTITSSSSSNYGVKTSTRKNVPTPKKKSASFKRNKVTPAESSSGSVQ